MLPERKIHVMHIKNISKMIMTMLVITALLIFSYKIMERFGLHFIYSWMNMVLIVLFDIELFALIVMFLKKNEKYKTIKGLILSMILIGSIFVTFLYYLFFNMESKPYYFSQSPMGEHQLIVLQGGFIDAIYHAYPVKYRIFYKYQDNGYVSRHDVWGGAGVNIEWKDENNAIVKIDYGSISSYGYSNGNNIDDIINVNLN